MENNITLIHTAIGTIACQTQNEPPVGSVVTLSIRPESTRVIEGGNKEGQNTFRGKVESLLFIGDAYEGVIKVGETSLITRIEVDTNIKEGDEVGLHVYPGKCSVLY